MFPAAKTTRRVRLSPSCRGCGASANNVYYVHPGYLGQWQESHRDQGHSSLGISLVSMP